MALASKALAPLVKQGLSRKVVSPFVGHQIYRNFIGRPNKDSIFRQVSVVLHREA